MAPGTRSQNSIPDESSSNFKISKGFTLNQILNLNKNSDHSAAVFHCRWGREQLKSQACYFFFHLTTTESSILAAQNVYIEMTTYYLK